MTNSISTIFTMDIYRHMSGGEKSERQLVRTGRIASFSALVIAMIVARPLLGNFDQAFQYIQEFTGFFTPGIVAIFLLGIFWNRTTAAGALSAAIGSAGLSLAFKLLWPSLPFIDRVGLAFLLCLGLGVLVSQLWPAAQPHRGIHYSEVDRSTSRGFNFASLVIVLMLTALYATWW